LLAEHIKGLPCFPEFRAELKRLLISSAGFGSAALLLKELAEPKVSFAGGGLDCISDGVGELHFG